MRVDGRIGSPATATDGMEGIPLRQGRTGETIVTGLHGTYYEQCARKSVFCGMNLTAGVAITQAGNNLTTLFNPLGTNVNCSMIRLYLSCAMDATNAFTGLVWAYTLNAGSSQATAAPILTFANLTTVFCTLIGSQTAAKARFGTANTFTAAPTTFGMVGVGETAMTAAGTLGPNKLIVEYEGQLVVSPGTAISLCSTSATTTTKYNVTFVWEEIPI